jgi:2-oxo-4-hydroxy-4-carboxy-5-ureidoimidazoline decarboxylase
VSIQHFNALSARAAREALFHCCCSHRWVEGMLAERPFADDLALRGSASRVWRSLGEADWLEAFAGHPRIGDIDSLHARFSGSRELAQREQAGVRMASDSVIERLAAGNAAYEKRFGFIFIVCATGKSAREMCELLEERLGNERATELAIAADEQLKILLIRVEQLL